MKTLNILLLVNYILSVLAVFNMIFTNKKKSEKIIAWTLFLIIPFIGILTYLIIGAGLTRFQKNMIKKFEISNKEYHEHIKSQIDILKEKDKIQYYSLENKDLILLNLNNANSIFSINNDLKFYLDGESVVEDLISDIKNAKSTIHLEFYIFAHDKIGKKLIALLTQKAKEGVEVRLIYDAVGSMHTSKHAFKKLKNAGASVTQFFPPFLHIKYLNFKANYRNHRKICVIDGKIGYTGGFNIRDDHLGKVKRLSPWRDTSAKIVGGAVHSLQNIFLSDWRFAVKDFSSQKEYENEKYFPSVKNDKNNKKVPMQIITSGPDCIKEEIKTCLIKMINSAKTSIKIQTPYFIPDEAFLGALKLALLSGVKVELMFPQKIDHWHVHYASLSYINDMLKLGVNVYTYRGFMHSKVVIVDDEILTFGSCNIDIRSFSLNFEDNVVIYSKKKVKEYVKYFEKDKENCDVHNKQKQQKFSIFKKLLISFCKLFSSIM